MPRPGPRRQALAVKIDDDERARIAALAVEHGVVKASGEPNLSEMARQMLATVQTMPKEK